MEKKEESKDYSHLTEGREEVKDCSCWCPYASMGNCYLGAAPPGTQCPLEVAAGEVR